LQHSRKIIRIASTSTAMTSTRPHVLVTSDAFDCDTTGDTDDVTSDTNDVTDTDDNTRDETIQERLPL
jgi:hypothetical protein